MKVKYIDGPQYEKANEFGHIRLTKDYCFLVDDKEFWCPKFYSCDGASIPRLFWPIAGSPFDPEKVPAAFAHDAIYLTHAFTRADADEILFQLLMQGGCKLRTARTMWAAVRAFAGFAWKNGEYEKSELAKMRTMIEARPDKEKFSSLWFAIS
jgi:hypothetical protein